MNAKLALVALACIISLAAQPLHAATWYVTQSGAGQLDGSAWANARPGYQLQLAIDGAAPGDQVWVQFGTYRPTMTSDRAAAFHMRHGVAIYGSFAGNETLVSERPFAGGPISVLSGEIGAPGIQDNSYHVISNTGLDATAILDGFVIRDANDDRPASSTEGLGGGIFNDGTNGGQCSPTIRYCVITSNGAAFGAGIFNSGYLGQSSPVIESCIIVQNYAYTGGGGIDNFGLAGIASPSIVNTLVVHNGAAFRAGGMYCWGGNNGEASPTIVNSVFAHNTAVDGGGLVADNLNTGAGSSGTARPIFRNSIVWGNTATGSGPQFFTLGDGACSATYTDIDLSGQVAPHMLSGASTGNIGSDPLFLNSANVLGMDGYWMTADDGFALQSLSPCRDVGNGTGLPLRDLLQAPRVNNGVVDLGAYEYIALPLASQTQADASMQHGHAAGQLSISPNPSTGPLHLRGAAPGEHAYLLDAQGRTCAQWRAHAGEMDFGGLPSGMYVVVVRGRDGLRSLRWVKR